MGTDGPITKRSRWGKMSTPVKLMTAVMCAHALITGLAMALSPYLFTENRKLEAMEFAWYPWFGDDAPYVIPGIGICKLLAFLSIGLGAGGWLPPFSYMGSHQFWDLTANTCLLVVYIGGAMTHSTLGEDYWMPLVFTLIGFVRICWILADGEPQIKCVCGNFGCEEWINRHLSHPNNQKAGEHGLTDKKAN